MLTSPFCKQEPIAVIMSSLLTSRDWSVLPDDVAFDQASSLPDTAHTTLGKNKIALEKPTEFGTWLKAVSQTLRGYGLQSLIDIQIPRPKRVDPNADKWLHLSIIVKKWLEQGVSEELMRKIKASGKRVELADEFVDQAKRVCEGSKVNTDMEKIVPLLTVQRSGFANTAEFVCSFRDKYLELEEKGVVLSPYLAFFMLLQQLELDDRPIVTSIIIMIHGKTANMDNWRIFKHRDFQKVCEKILESLDKATPGTQGAVPHASILSENLLDVSPLGGKIHSPAPGVSPEVHVKAWCEKQPQMNELGQCTYCTYPFHGPAKCFYLNPYLRPLDWKPVDNMWVYKPELNSGRRQWTKSPIVDTGSGSLLDSLVSSNLKTESLSVTKEEDGKGGAPIKSYTPLESLPLIDRLGFTATRQDWQIVTTFSHHIAADRALLVEYKEYGSGDTPFEWMWNTGARERALGTGKAKIALQLADGNINTAIVNCVYQPKCRFSILSTVQLRKDLGVSFDAENLTFLHFLAGDLKVFGLAVEENGVAFLRTKTFHPQDKKEAIDLVK